MAEAPLNTGWPALEAALALRHAREVQRLYACRNVLSKSARAALFDEIGARLRLAKTETP